MAARNSTAIAQRFALYNQGLTDAEIARRTGRPRKLITSWRRCRGLAPHIGALTCLPLKPAQRAARMLLYQLGWSDYHIAREQKVDPSAIRRWRQCLGLAPNYAPGVNEKRYPAQSLDAVVDRVRRAIGRALPRDIAQDALADMTLAILDGSLSLDSIEKEARRYGNRVLDRFASRYGPKSLDEVIDGTDDMRAIDLLQDQSSSSWLEEMGATVW